MRCLNSGCQVEGLNPELEICPGCRGHLPTQRRDTLPKGTLLNNYRIEYPIARGGFGITYLANHLDTAQQVAIKECFPAEEVYRQGLEVLPRQPERWQRSLGRFREEARRLEGINHPGIVRHNEDFSAHGTHYLVMQYLQGKTLKQHLEQSRLSLAGTEELAKQVVAALDSLHRQNLFHLDLKPENIIYEQGKACILDFGSARSEGKLQSTVMLTEQYAPPEVLSHADVGPFSDIFELGMILFECLTGSAAPSTLARIAGTDIDWSKIPESFRERLIQALNLEPFKRPQDIFKWWVNSQIDAPPVIHLGAPKKDPLGSGFVNALNMRFRLITPSLNVQEHMELDWIQTPYYLMQTPVTRQQWSHIMKEDPSTYSHDEQLPVHNVSWQDAQQFLARLNQVLNDGGIYRLPHEWEWEYAASQSQRQIPRVELQNYAWFGLKEKGSRGPVGPQVVAQKQPNSWGLYDCLGNVWEWCLERYSPQMGEVGLEPRDPSWVVNRVQRGGGWYSPSRRCQVNYRDFARSDLRNPGFGFRILREIRAR